jgi:hypothetical protein
MPISVALMTLFVHFTLGLPCEAGMNDGSAFPFVMLGLGLHDLRAYGTRWILVDVLWATSAGILIGVVLGSALGRLSMMLRHDRLVWGARYRLSLSWFMESVSSRCSNALKIYADIDHKRRARRIINALNSCH